MVGRVRAARLSAEPDPAFVSRLERDVLRAFAVETGRSATSNALRPGSLDGPTLPRSRVAALTARRELGRGMLALTATFALLVVTISLAFFVFAHSRNAAVQPPADTPVASPTASPVGTPLSTRPPGAGINIVGVDGTGLAALGNDTDAADPVWSPDGTRFAFASKDGIYVMNADGSGRTLVADT